MVTPPNAINATLYEKLNFNFVRDIAPVAGISREPNVFVVSPSLPAKTIGAPRLACPVRQTHSG